MMTTLTKYMKKTTAIAMAAMVLSLPLASVASAHGRHNPPPPPPRHSDSYYTGISCIIIQSIRVIGYLYQPKYII